MDSEHTGTENTCVCVSLCVYPALSLLPFITKATGTLDDTSTSSDGGGERLEKVIR
jgi:hypothetical protein